MIIELFIATLYAFIAIVAWRGILSSSVGIIFTFLAGLILFIAAIEIVTAVDLAVTSTSDIGQVRKVGNPAIAAAIIALWFAPKWLAPRPKEA